MARTIWRGVVLDERSAAMMDEVAQLVEPYLVPTQGAYSNGGVAASAGTHDGGGSIDLSAAELTPDQRYDVVYNMRRVGWAAWLRTPAQANWGYHIHAIAVNCDDLSYGAYDQVEQYFNGTNGLYLKGQDDGPRDFVGTTWESYVAAKPAPVEPPKIVPPYINPTEDEEMAFLSEYSLGPDQPAGIVFMMSADLAKKTHVRDPATLNNLIAAGYKVIPISKEQIDNAVWDGYDGKDPAAVINADSRIASIIASIK